MEDLIRDTSVLSASLAPSWSCEVTRCENVTIDVFWNTTRLTVEILQLRFCLTVSLDGLKQVWDEFAKLFKRVEIALASDQVSNMHNSCAIAVLTRSAPQQQQGPKGPVHHPTAPAPSAHSSCQTRK